MKGSLFSNYFLEEGIKTTEDWKRLSDEELQKLYLEIENKYKAFSKRKNPDEADTEDGLICPTLEILGFQWSRQKSPTKKGRQDVPDFVLFPDDKSKEEFDKESPESKPWDKSVCILEGKRWKRALDKGDKTDPIDPHVPSNQILRYLSIVEPASNGKIVWGILTNGELWRLYYHRAPSRAEGFIEFDLSEFFESPNLFNNREKQLEKFKIFYLLFRKEAFIQTEWRVKSYLEIALEEGKRWEEKVSENLKEKIFYEVFPNIAKGLIEDAKLKDEIIDEAHLEEIYENTLVILYRLLFLFYAEDRELLPIKINGYKYYSLSKIREEIADIIDRKEALSERGTFFWGRIRNLFKVINEGDQSLGIPPYNGGLFDSQKNPLLDELCVSDKFLVPAIDKLSRDFTTTPPKRINYNDLSVRQLGSIYEGLLEFKLKIAEKDLGIKRENGKEFYYPVESEKEAKIKKGEIYLTNDKAERKATGSYYTPEYIVQYIVKNTLEPLIQEKIKIFEEWEETLKNKNKNELKKLIEEYNINFDPKLYDNKGKIIGEKDINAYRNVLLSLKDPAEGILRLKILDPAMGSGHFLVGAVDYLADRILEILAEISEKNYFGKEIYRSPLIYKLEDIRNRIIEKAKKEGFIIDEKRLEDKNLIKRVILKRCIYGVDLNPLAVELAKLSLWLHTFTIGASLSFLDHHLKCGNSLIGASTVDFEKVFQKYPMFGSQYVGIMNAIELVEKIQELTDIDISEVEESLKLYESLLKELEPYKKLLDLYTADLYLQQEGKSLIRILSGTNGNPLEIVKGRANLKKEELNLINYALTLAKNKKFFHWELEFPEVWYEKGGKKKDGGFDAIIGNPPYIIEVRENKNLFRDLKISPSVGKYYEDKMDIFYFFIEYGIDLLKKNGNLGFIVQEYWMTRAKATKLRQKIFRESKPIEFVLFKDFKIFKEAIGQHNMILILTKKERKDDDMVKIRIINIENLKKLKEKINKIIDENDILINELNKDNSEAFLSFSKKLSSVYSIKTDKVYVVSEGLSEKLEKLKANEYERTFNLEDNEIQQGLVTPQHFLRGTGEGIFVLSEDEKKKYRWTEDEERILKPFYHAKQIDRYFYPIGRNEYYLIYTPVETCVEIERYLLKSKIEGLLNESLEKLKDFISIENVEKFLNEFTPHLDNESMQEFKRLFDMIKNDESVDKISDYLNNIKVFQYPNIVNHLLKYKDFITSDNKPFGIHRARQPDWFENPHKIIGVRKTNYPKFVVVDKPFYMDQSVLIIRLFEHKDYSPYYVTAIFNSKLGWWWFYNQKRQGDQLQIDKEVLLNFPVSEIDFINKHNEKLKTLKFKYENKDFSSLTEAIKTFPSSSAVLHDFLSFLAQKMIELNRNKYLLELFIEGKLQKGSEERIKVIELLEKHPQWKNGTSETYQKEIAEALINLYREQIQLTDKLIDQIVYHLYALDEEDINIIENFFNNKTLTLVGL